MSALFVFDASSLLSIGTHLNQDQSLIANACSSIHLLIKSGGAGFPTAVARQCSSFASKSFVGAWVQAAASDVITKDVPFTHQKQVLARCPTLWDDLDPYNTHVDVLAYAHFMTTEFGLDVTVVTDDIGILAMRMSVAEACVRLGFHTIAAGDLLSTL